MLYVIMVSHGELAQGLHSAVKMIAGDRQDVFSISLKDGMSGDQYAENFQKLIAAISPSAKIILLADIIGGSPLTTALKVLADKNLVTSTRVFGGMNLPLALGVILSGETAFTETAEKLLTEAKDALQEFNINLEQTDEDI
ncbi:PTS sugar transporter subunit IIA [Pectinatus cerevisiiphilus]|uniref:PTS system N-acetylgalactosamine-specific IIA component n=1 Tax=Pectinatus cerevisiiphilus TaxID=86956 RepID=A0A4R3K5T4_9FIRM|nr:PTS fructose transporter subunit IIA [Pectinatus cerevisiiphilus]TCS78176.1 PTS system N-acetylgalactosamine-specific IIA component [Pectinatus cerevisiiphilus]